MVEGHTNWTSMFLQFMFLICSVCNTHGVASAASPSCASDEYRAGQLCCFACPGGYRVHRDCTATTISLCSKCPVGTFKEGLSGQKQCSACTKCDPGQKEKKPCTPTSDAECVIRDGFFCSDSADNDTLSEATLSCQPHTICDSGVQMKPGTDSTDSTCIKYVTIVFIIIGCIFFIISIIVVAVLVYKLKVEWDLTELQKQIDEMETLEQWEECQEKANQIYDKKMKTQKQKTKFDRLLKLHQEKSRKILKVDMRFNEWVYRRILEGTQESKTLNECIEFLLEETPEQCRELANQIREKNGEKQEQERELCELIDQLQEKLHH